MRVIVAQLVKVLNATEFVTLKMVKMVNKQTNKHTKKKKPYKAQSSSYHLDLSFPTSDIELPVVTVYVEFIYQETDTMSNGPCI